MSSGGALPPTLNTPPFNPFFPLFSTQQHFFPCPPNQQRIKLKRQRQRVDAGEPRNSYQPTKQTAQTLKQESTSMSVNEIFPSFWMQTTETTIEDEATDLTTKVAPEEETQEVNHLENEGEETGEEARVVNNASGGESTTSSASSSSSRRKSCFPQKTTNEIVDQEGKEASEGGDLDDNDWMIMGKEETADELEKEEDEEEGAMSALQAQLDAPNGGRLNELLEAQKKLCLNLFENQKKASDDKSGVKDLSGLAAILKSEILNSVTTSIDKIITEWVATETARMQCDRTRPLFPQLPIYPSYPATIHGGQVNPFGLTTASIFPPPFPFMNTLNASLRKEEENKRKRRLETPSVRSKMVAFSPADCDATPTSERASPMIRSTPLSSYLPATMVGNSFYDACRFDGVESPNDSDDVSDCGPYDPNISQSSTLTPMHLRKAKLMFFYTRYPNSSLLKQYFPDIRFNKNNTAQLVKWFSNFREFYYNQMDKYAKQAVAEGIQKRDDLIVTKESEIFKQLNQHYNRNNHVEAPEQLVRVVQDTLREFYEAIKQGKHNEPSWKKQIYKVICRFDEPIPEYFKDPNFLERLE